MFLSNNPGFIFVHVPKTGGMSMFNALCQATRLDDNGRVAGRNTLLTEPNRYMHSRYDAIVKRNPQAVRYFAFGFVRNPWDRMVSFYMAANRSFDLADFKRVINTSTLMQVPQYKFLMNSRTGQPIDFIGRFEHIEADFAAVCQKLGLKAALMHINKSYRNPNYRQYYDVQARAMVAARCKEDIKRFGYEF